MLSRPVLYYAQYDGLGNDLFTGQPLFARMSNLGNPWIWWTSLPCVAVAAVLHHPAPQLPAAVILLGFITQYLPWAPITRVLFMYHMFGGLIFMVLALAFVLRQIAGPLAGAAEDGRASRTLALAVMFFVYFYPVWTAVPISNRPGFQARGTPPWGPRCGSLNCKRPAAEHSRSSSAGTRL